MGTVVIIIHCNNFSFNRHKLQCQMTPQSKHRTKSSFEILLFTNYSELNSHFFGVHSTRCEQAVTIMQSEMEVAPRYLQNWTGWISVRPLLISRKCND